MTDMKKLMIDADTKSSQRFSLEQLAEAAEATPIDLSPVDCRTITGLRRVRVASGHALLAYYCDQGILVYDRRSGLQHIWTWNNLRAIIASIEEK